MNEEIKVPVKKKKRLKKPLNNYPMKVYQKNSNLIG